MRWEGAKTDKAIAKNVSSCPIKIVKIGRIGKTLLADENVI